MIVLVSGASGFVGQAVVSALRVAGHTVVGLGRDPARLAAGVPGLAEARAWPAFDVPPDLGGLTVDAVVHLAGEPVSGRWTAARRRLIRESRVTGTRTLVEALRRAGQRPARFVSASAIGYYGDRGEEPLPESAAPGEDFLASVCVDWEAAAREADSLGAVTTQLRLGIVLGPGGGALARMLPLHRRGLAGPLGPGTQWWSWVHRDDVVGLVVWALDGRVHGAVNAVAPAAERQLDVSRALCRRLGRRAWLPTPAFALRLALGGFASELLASKRVLPERVLASGYAFRFPGIDDAVKDLLSEG